MKKNIFIVLFMVLALLFVSCDNLANSNNDDNSNSNTNTETNDNGKISAGWYKFTRDAQNDFPELRAVLIYINNEGKVERVGNEVWEYENTAPNFKNIYAELSSKDIRDDFFQPTTAPNYKYLNVEYNEKLNAGWYYYERACGEPRLYTYITSKGTVTIAGTTERYSSKEIESLYTDLYHDQASIAKTEEGFHFMLGDDSRVYFSTRNIPEWCSSFEYF